MSSHIPRGRRINFIAELPGTAGMFIPIVSPKPHSPVHVIITSDSWQGTWTHHYLDRTKPCLGSEFDCEGCAGRHGKRFKGYLCGALFGTGRDCIIELTHGAIRACPDLVTYNGQLRGLRMVLKRTGTAKNGPVKVEIGNRLPDHAVPQDFNLMRALCKVWDFPYTECEGDAGTTYIPAV